MCAVQIVILAEMFQLSLQVTGIPKERLVKVLSANGPDQSFDERSGKDTPDHIFIDVDSKGLIDLLCYPRAAKPRVALLQLHDRLNEYLRRTLGAGFSFITS